MSTGRDFNLFSPTTNDEELFQQQMQPSLFGALFEQIERDHGDTAATAATVAATATVATAATVAAAPTAATPAAAPTAATPAAAAAAATLATTVVASANPRRSKRLRLK